MCARAFAKLFDLQGSSGLVWGGPSPPKWICAALTGPSLHHPEGQALTGSWV